MVLLFIFFNQSVISSLQKMSVKVAVMCETKFMKYQFAKVQSFISISGNIWNSLQSLCSNLFLQTPAVVQTVSNLLIISEHCLLYSWTKIVDEIMSWQQS